MGVGKSEVESVKSLQSGRLSVASALFDMELESELELEPGKLAKSGGGMDVEFVLLERAELEPDGVDAGVAPDAVGFNPELVLLRESGPVGVARASDPELESDEVGVGFALPDAVGFNAELGKEESEPVGLAEPSDDVDPSEPPELESDGVGAGFAPFDAVGLLRESEPVGLAAAPDGPDPVRVPEAPALAIRLFPSSAVSHMTVC